jgi:hypothetical protein
LLVLSQSFPLRFLSAFSISPLKLFFLFGSTLLLIVSSNLSLILSVIFFFFTQFLLFLLFNHLSNQLTQFVKSIANLF